MGQRQRIAKAVALRLLETVGWEGNEKHCIQEANANLPPKMPLIVGLNLKQPKEEEVIWQDFAAAHRS
jgi:hypothetical protein